MVGGGPTPASTGNPVIDAFRVAYGFVKTLLGKKVFGFTVKSIITAATFAYGVKGWRDMQDLMSKGQEILATKVAQGGKIPVLYGRRRVGSTVVFLDTADNRSKDLFVVYALATGECDQIELESIELDGNSIRDTKRFRQGYYAGSDKIASGAGSLNTANQVGDVQVSNAGRSGTDPTKRYRMVFNAHHGAASQTADPMLRASIGAKWTTAHKLNGITYIAASYEFDTKAMFKGIPQLTVIVKGKKVYDPRLDSSISGGSGSHRINDVDTYEWSDNPALCFLNYITNDSYGKGLGSSAIDLQSFQTAANTADTLIDTPDYGGSYNSTTWSYTAGARTVYVDEDTWKDAKIGGVLTIKDGDANIVFDGCTIVGKQRREEYDENPEYAIFLDCDDSTTYTDEDGTSLVKVKRFTCNGMLDPSGSVLENARDLLANMRGIFNYNEGVYELKIEDTESSSFTVTDQHIIGDVGVQVQYESKDQKANKVVVEYYNPTKGYELDTVTVFHDPNDDGTFTDYKDDDGGEELELKVSFPYISNPYVAYNMGLAILKRSRNQKTISFLSTPELYKTKVGDVITVDYTPVGSPSGLYRIEALNLQPDGLISVRAIQYLDIYTWEDPSAENVEDLVNQPQTHAVKAPTGLAFTDSNASATNRPYLSWNEPTDFPNHQYRVSIVDASSNKLLNKFVDDEFVDCNFLPKGSNYVASVSSINSIGSESDAATLTFSVSIAPVDTDDVKNDAITTAKLVDDAITNAKIAVDAIQGDVIAAGAITENKLYTGAVTTDKLAANAVTAAKITANTITASQIASGTITATEILSGTLTSASGVFGAISANDISTGTLNASIVSVTNLDATNINTGTLSASRLNIDGITLENSGGQLIIKSGGVDTGQIATDAVTTPKLIDRATSVFATATGSVGYWYVDNLAQTAIVTTGVFQAPSTTGNTFFVIGNTYINANSGSSTADWCELQVQRRSASTSGGVSSAAYSTIATIRARGETGEALQSIIANDAYTADYYYQYRVTLQTNGTGTLYSTRSYGINGIQVIVNYK